MFRILVSDKVGKEGLELLKQAEDVSFDLKTGLSKTELLQIIPEYDALLVRSETKVDAEVMQAGVNLKVVGRAGMGVDNIDVPVATKRGIVVMNTPRANSIATAEQTLGLMLAISRHTVSAHNSLLTGEWNRSKFVGVELYGKYLGVVGFGNIGRLVASRALAFGMNVLAYDPYVSEAVAHEMGVTLVDLDDLLEQSDYITLHTVSSPETQKMINTQTINQMKKGVIILNVARGKLIDELALAEALKSGKVKAAAIDVFSQEPPQPDHPLIGLPNVLHTPHLGASSMEAQRIVAIEIVEQVLDALRGKGVRNAVNMPFQVGPDFHKIQPHMVLAETLGKLQYHMAPAPIQRVELAVRGDMSQDIIRPAAAALLKGLLNGSGDSEVNYINAPVIATERGVMLTQVKDMSASDYPNLMSCWVYWEGGQRMVSGVLFGGSELRVVQVEDYHLEANPRGTLLIMRNRDVPGVIGQVGTILAAYDVNIGEWRMGRSVPGGEALSFISLDSEPPIQVLDALQRMPAITQVKLLSL